MKPILSLAILVGIHTTAAAATDIACRPDMPTIELKGVPQLWEATPTRRPTHAVDETRAGNSVSVDCIAG